MQLDHVMQFFGQMMQEIQQLKKEHSAQIEQLDDDIQDYIKTKYAHKKQKRWRDEDESTIESNPKVDIALKSLFDFDKLHGIKKTPM